MQAVEVGHIVKSFADKVVVNDLSFSVAQGEIFGLIGPNGAGKTTTIRMMMDIIKPDSGEVTILGEKLSEATKNKLGYLPEERGLYKKLRVLDSIIYLASLKGMDRHSAEEKANQLLSQTGMLPHKGKKDRRVEPGHGTDYPVHRWYHPRPRTGCSGRTLCRARPGQHRVIERDAR